MPDDLPYPHARHDCVACQELDADVEVLDDDGQPRRPPRELCRACLGHWLAIEVLRPDDSVLTVQLRVATAHRG